MWGSSRVTAGERQAVNRRPYMVPVIKDENKEESEKETEREEGKQEKEVLLRYRKDEIKKKMVVKPHILL